MEKVFKSIALCFSGGGFRAAGFSLGSLSFFEHIDILNNVKAISTVSGGTITGVKYAQALYEKSNFNDFLNNYYEDLRANNLTSNAVKNIKSFSVWQKKENKHKKQNPINAFAIEYNKMTNDVTLGNIQDCIEKNNVHVERFIFNATDFTNSSQFRFQNLDKPNRKQGNGKLPKEFQGLENKLKLGDILAASSAFPGGFEPIAFPDDFINKEFKTPEIGLMDGGIVDNQGTSSLFTSKPSKSEYDLYFINDVASPDTKNPFKFSNKNTLVVLLTYLSSVPVLILLSLLCYYFFKQGNLIMYSVTGLITSSMLTLQIILLYASSKLKKETSINESLYIPPRRLGVFLIDRISSLLHMASEVFLKNDRRQHYNALYGKFSHLSAASMVYELSCEKNGRPINESSWDEIKKFTGEIPKEIKDISKTCSNFSTTLWFSDDDKQKNTLDKLIACGEFTSCYNLIAFLIKNHHDKIEGQVKEYTDLFNNLIVQWNKFKSNPYFLINSRLKTSIK